MMMYWYAVGFDLTGALHVLQFQFPPTSSRAAVKSRIVNGLPFCHITKVSAQVALKYWPLNEDLMCHCAYVLYASFCLFLIVCVK